MARARTSLWTALLALVLAWCAAPALAQPRDAGPDKLPDTVAAFDRAFAAWQRQHNIKQATLAVSYRGRLVHVAGFGGLDGSERVHLASLSKAITAVCAARLVDADALRFESKLGEILGKKLRALGPPGDTRFTAITIGQLISHRAGIGGRDGDPATGNNLLALLNRQSPRAAEANAMLAPVIRAKLAWPPGTAYAYSNGGYLLLGAAIEAASGEDYWNYCRRTVLAPAGIGPTGFAPDWPVMGPYGGWALSGPEYLAFYRALEFGDLLGPKARAWQEDAAGKMLPNRKDIHYGLGLNLRKRGEQWTWWHTGSWTWSQPKAAGGPLTASVGALAARSELGASWFVYYTPMPSDQARVELDRALWRAARAVKNWPDDDKFAAYGVR